MALIREREQDWDQSIPPQLSQSAIVGLNSGVRLANNLNELFPKDDSPSKLKMGLATAKVVGTENDQLAFYEGLFWTEGMKPDGKNCDN